MRKSLAIIASALLLAVGAATHDRLRYDSSVFTDVRITGGDGQARRADYPPCVRGVREDRCIQLYERGVRRSYQRWLAANGGAERAADRSGARATPRCRGRTDDRCQQVGRQARAATRQARRQSAARQQAQRRAAVRRAQPARPTRAASRSQARAAATQRQRTRTAPMAQRTRTAAPTPRTRTDAPANRTRTAAPVRRPRGDSSTPGI